MNTFRRFLSILALLFIVGAPYARADDAAEARRRYNEGKAALEAGRYREAALHFEATGRLRKHAAAPYAAAMAWDKAEEPARAADNFHRALELPGLNNKSKKEAKERLELLEQSLGTVVVSGPEELVVQFEGSTEANPPARLHASPGINTLLVARDENIERRDVKLNAGEVVELDVTEPIAEPEPEPPPPASASATPEPPPPPPVVEVDTDSKQTRKIIGYSAMGAGVLSAGVAVTLGFKTMSARDDFEAERTQGSFDDAKQLRTWTNVAWAGAVVLGGVGAALVFWPTNDDDQRSSQEDTGVSLSATPTGVQLGGSF
jgi:hypothetical protein